VIDSHTHLYACAPPDAELVAEATEAGVRRLLTVGTTPETCAASLAAAQAHPEVFAAIGHHPNEAGSFDDAVLATLHEHAAHERCRAIGETGLDHFRDYAQPADQERAFRAHIDLARSVAKPLVIHTRAAEDDTLALLAAEAEDLDVILHCFSMPARLDECLEHPRWSFSFAGNVTYPANAELAAAAERIPDDRLLVETDAPYLTPVPMRKERNRPAFVAHTARFVAERRGQSYEELEALVEANASRLFAW
jgi:TatD DNase family protein